MWRVACGVRLCVWCGVRRCSVVRYVVLRCCVPLCCDVWWSFLLCCVVLCWCLFGVVLCGVVSRVCGVCVVCCGGWSGLGVLGVGGAWVRVRWVHGEWSGGWERDGCGIGGWVGGGVVRCWFVCFA